MSWIIEKLKRGWKWIVGILGVGAIAVALTVPNGTVNYPGVLVDGKSVIFAFTDENLNENLIIKTDSESYINGNEMYFSIENTTSSNQDINVVFTLKNSNAKVSNIEEFVSNSEIVTTASGSNPSFSKTVTGWNKKTVTKPDLKPIKDSIKSRSDVSEKATVGNDHPVFQTSIVAGQVKVFKARVDIPYGESGDYVSPFDTRKISVVTYAQEFFIEAYGHLGGYGHLDPIAFSSARAQEFAAATSYTVSNVVASAGLTNLYGVVMVGLRTNTGLITGVTFNGVSMASISSVNRNESTITNFMFGLAGPTTGNVVVSGDTSLAAEVIVSIYTGVAQTSSTGTKAAATGTGTTPTVDVTSATDELVVDSVGWNAGGDGTAGAGQTKRAEPVAGDGASMDIASSDEAGGATVTMSWTVNAGGGWAIVGIPLKPAVAAAGVKKQSEIWFD